MSTGKDPVTHTSVSRPQAELRRKMQDFDEKAMQLEEDTRAPQDLQWADPEQARRLPPVRQSVPNRNLDRMNKKAQAAKWLSEEAGGAGKGINVNMTPDDRDIDAADHARKNENLARFNNFVSTVLPSSRRQPRGPMSDVKKLSANMKPR